MKRILFVLFIGTYLWANPIAAKQSSLKELERENERLYALIDARYEKLFACANSEKMEFLTMAHDNQDIYIEGKCELYAGVYKGTKQKRLFLHCYTEELKRILDEMDGFVELLCD